MALRARTILKLTCLVVGTDPSSLQPKGACSHGIDEPERRQLARKDALHRERERERERGREKRRETDRESDSE